MPVRVCTTARDGAGERGWSMSEWTWDTDDFAALWLGDAHDRIPGPLRHLSRFAFHDEAAAHRVAVRNRYSADELDEIAAALRTLAASDIRIEILGGSCRHRNSTGRDDLREYRVLGARAGHRAVVLTQHGTETEHGPIRLRAFDADQLPARLTQAVPACRPGNERPETFHPTDLEPRRDGYLQDNARNTPRERYRRLLGRQADGGGTAALLTGPLHSAVRPLDVLQWYDITDDGRYTEHRGAHITVRPTTPAELTRHFTDWITTTLNRLHADADY
ncbi:ESX secretion-associated protein EspG [Nocardia farcinica]|nr:ESX secretion-associated protein EspG [Nocardia farcinica]MBF6417519.1 ESX secretion-associated protein EspG [Nocardia farcinica]MBF6428975.1 ESX secretion-associated protein EspG [Nocardia farcinica]MBF6501879.1 ESX secretion-associated protein EspG [Nocardia farcinica]